MSFEDRFTFALAHLIGTIVRVRVKCGDVWRGLFFAAEPHPGGGLCVTLKYAQLMGQAKAGQKQIPLKNVLVIPPEEFVQLDVQDIEFSTATDLRGSYGNKFATDTQISGGDRAGKQRQLQAVNNSWLLGDQRESSLSGAAGTWDQFETNERKFGVKASFDESMYTTSLHGKYSQSDLAEADRIAREIEKTPAPSNPHIAEERNIKTSHADEDEESKYSSVAREAPVASGATGAMETVPDASNKPAKWSDLLRKQRAPKQQVSSKQEHQTSLLQQEHKDETTRKSSVLTTNITETSSNASSAEATTKPANSGAISTTSNTAPTSASSSLRISKFKATASEFVPKSTSSGPGDVPHTSGGPSQLPHSEGILANPQAPPYVAQTPAGGYPIPSSFGYGAQQYQPQVAYAQYQQAYTPGMQVYPRPSMAYMPYAAGNAQSMPQAQIPYRNAVPRPGVRAMPGQPHVPHHPRQH